MRTSEMVKNEWQNQGMKELYWDNPVLALSSSVNRHIRPILDRARIEQRARRITRLCEILDMQYRAERAGDMRGIATAYLYRQLLEQRG